MTTTTIHADDVFAEALRTYARKFGKSADHAAGARETGGLQITADRHLLSLPLS